MKSIQFVGTQRSGSNLLRLILNQHPEISAPHPPHILKTFFPLIPHYQKFGTESHLELVKDLCDWIERNPVPWTGLKLNAEEVAQESTDLVSAFEQIYVAKANVDEASIWCCKSTFNIHYARELEATIRPIYLHLYRDGRDVAASFMKTIIGEKHIYFLAKQWEKEQQLSNELLEGIEESRRIRVSYEDLLGDPESTIRLICEKIQLEFHPDMLMYYMSEESQHTAESGRMWEKVTEPIIRGNHDKFRSEFSSEEIRIFEQVARNMLKRMGYGLTSDSSPTINLDVKEFDRINELRKANILQNVPAQDLERRSGQTQLLAEINAKLGIGS